MSSNTRLSDVVLEDAKLSMTAKGAFVSIGFFGNGCKLEQLVNACTDSSESIAQAIAELEQAGYVNFDEDKAIHITTPSSFGALGS